MKQLLVLSGKGGTGKTTLVSAFIKLGNIKAYADCDVDAPNLHIAINHISEPITKNYYGMDKAKIDIELCIKCGICEENCRFHAISSNREYKVDYFSCEGCGLCQELCPVNAITLHPAVAGEIMLYNDEALFSTAKLKMGSGNSGLLVTEVKKQLKSAVKQIELAIIDGSSGIGCPVIASLSGVDMVLIVAEPSLSGISDMQRIIKTANNFNTIIGVCVNKYDVNIENTKKIERYCEEYNLPVVGRIPFDQQAVKAVNTGITIVDIDCVAGEAVKEVFRNTIDMLLK